MIELTQFKHCPSCGKPSVKDKDPKAMVCTSCGYVYYHNTAAAVAAVIEVEDKILLTVRAHEPKAGMYDCPGGFVDYNESAEEACRREIREELGVDIEVQGFLGTFPNRYEYRSVIYHTTDIFLVCRFTDESAVLRPNDELLSVKYFTPEEIPFERLGFESMKLGLGEYVRRREME